jgi:TRAP-type mannitol/chloroaromatic compound transport system substrate-binding protein
MNKIKRLEKLLKTGIGASYYSRRLDALNIEIYYNQKKMNRMLEEIQNTYQVKEIMESQNLGVLNKIYDLCTEIKMTEAKLKKAESRQKILIMKRNRSRKLYDWASSIKPVMLKIANRFKTTANRA